MIHIFWEDISSSPQINNSLFSSVADSLATDFSKKIGEITVIFCSDRYLLEINKKFLNHDYFTDVITFDYSNKEELSGDIYISVERVSENAKKWGETFEKELYRVMLHGILHLAGQGDHSPAEKEKMREYEELYLGEF